MPIKFGHLVFYHRVILVVLAILSIYIMIQLYIDSVENSPKHQILKALEQSYLENKELREKLNKMDTFQKKIRDNPLLNKIKIK